jgi:hypothetical protein
MKKLVLLSLLCLVAMSFLLPKEDPDQLAWSPDIKLKWEDFQGLPDSVSSAPKAFTRTAMKYEYKLQKDAVQVEAVCYFDRKLSWVSAKKTAQTAQQLKHEQLHFDMAELMARKIRKELSIYTSKDIPATQAHIDKINAQYFEAELKTMTTAYDTETNHGATDSKQKKWDTKIAGELKKLEAFAEPKVEIKRQK